MPLPDAPTLTPSPEPSPTPVAAPETPPPSWFDKLTPELQQDKHLSAFKGKSESDLAKSFAEAQKIVSGSIRLPSEKDTPEQRATKLDEIATKMGRPAQASEYVITPPVLPEKMAFDDAMATAFKPVAHQLRLTQEQVAGVVKFQLDHDIAAHQAREAERHDWEQSLKTEWGGAYPRNRALAIRGLTDLGGKALGDTEAKALLDMLDHSGLGDFPPLVKLFAQIGADANEGALVIGSEPVLTAASVEAEIAKIQQLPEFLDASHPNHQTVLDKYLDLFKQKTSSMTKAMQL